MAVLRCKLCGELFNRSVDEYMGHLIYSHRNEFIDRCEQYFFEDAESYIDDLWNSLNDSEKVGVRFGMFPARLNLTHAAVVALMEKAEQTYGKL